MVPPTTVIFPFPRSVAMAAQCWPAVVIFTSVQVMLPVWVASTPREPSAEVLIVTLDRVTEEPDPVAKTPFAPLAFVVTVQLVSSIALPDSASTSALRPCRYFHSKRYFLSLSQLNSKE